MLHTSIFSFSHSVFKRQFPQGLQKSSLYDKKVMGPCKYLTVLRPILTLYTKRQILRPVQLESICRRYFKAWRPLGRGGDKEALR